MRCKCYPLPANILCQLENIDLDDDNQSTVSDVVRLQ
jgi:hypothetical protein